MISNVIRSRLIVSNDDFPHKFMYKNIPQLKPFTRSNVKFWILYEIASYPEKKYSNYELSNRCGGKKNSPQKNSKSKICRELPDNQYIKDIITNLEDYLKPEHFFENPVAKNKPFQLNSVNYACKDLIKRGLLLKEIDLSEKWMPKNVYILTSKGFFTLIYLLIQKFSTDYNVNLLDCISCNNFTLNFIAKYWFLWRDYGIILDEARVIWSIIKIFNTPHWKEFEFLLADLFFEFLDACIRYSPFLIDNQDLKSNEQYEREIWTTFLTNVIKYLISSGISISDYIFDYEAEYGIDNGSSSNPLSDLLSLIKDEIESSVNNQLILWDIIHQSEHTLENAHYLASRYNFKKRFNPNE